ncbi:acetyltransferase [Metabacillus sp. 84]|uniref:acetyltransferase n=1 Tax=unclassified Metabacillus TaxID=2675274 RepID=UPI003CF39EC8
MVPLVIIGNGGHSKVIQEMASLSDQYEVIAILDDCVTEIKMIENIVHGPSAIVNEFTQQETKFFIAIGDNSARQRVYQKLRLADHQYATLIHPSAIISQSASIGFGTAVMPNSVINADARVGSHCILNTGSIIEHDSLLHDFVHISPNSTLTGSVKIGTGVHIGASATVIPGKEIGVWTVIGAGAAVIGDIPSHCLAAGVPAKIKKNHKIRRREA